MRKTLALVAVAAGVVVAGLVSTALATCQSVDPSSLDPITACTGAGEEAKGTVAVSLAGDAKGSGPLPALAVSGSGNADHSAMAVSNSGRAGDETPDNDAPCADAERDQTFVSASASGNTYSCFVSVSGSGTSRSGLVGVSATGDSGGRLASVSGTGNANGHWNQQADPKYAGALVAVSGCHADNTGPQDQLVTADPTRVWVLTNSNPLTGQPGPTEVKTGLSGVCM